MNEYYKGYMGKGTLEVPKSYISIVQKSIVKMDTEIIVNAANRWLQAGGGVCGAIFQAAGSRKLQKACNDIGLCPTGSAVITPGFDLCKYIIHAVGPEYRDGRHCEAILLYNSYKNSLNLAKEYGCHTIAFPLISAGIYGYPVQKAWRKALQAVSEWIKANEGYKMVVTFAVLDDNVLDTGLDTAEELGIKLF